MDFLEQPFAGFALIDVPSGTVVATLRSVDALTETLHEEQRESPDRIWRLEVEAFDKNGAELRRMSAGELLALV